MQKFVLFAFVVGVLLVGALAQNYCSNVAPEDTPPSQFLLWNYGIQDSENGALVSVRPFRGGGFFGCLSGFFKTPYTSRLEAGYWDSNYDNYVYQNDAYLGNFFNYYVNSKFLFPHF
jgi:hypothetical protein